MTGFGLGGVSTRLFHLLDRLRSSYWFVPSLMFLGAVGLAFGALEVDRRWVGPKSDLAWVYLGGAEGARSVLAVIAGSIVTVAGVVFSITIVTLAQAASHFGPRILRRFMRDTGNQVVLGTFVATFVYCLLVLRMVRGEAEGPFVPHASVAIAVLLAVLSIQVLIYFIHHVASSLQAPMVIDALGADLAQAMGGIGCAPTGADAEPASPSATRPATPAEVVCGRRSGYLQAIDLPGLVAAARECDLVLHVEVAPGDWVLDGGRLLEARPPARCDAALAERLAGAFLVGPQRTTEQDVRYALAQGVDIAVRALSPSLNDVFTALNCIDWLAGALLRLGRAPAPAFRHCDDDGALRVVQPSLSFAALVDVAFDQIRGDGARNPAVLRRLLEALEALARQLAAPHQRRAFVEHADRILRVARRELVDAEDVAAVVERHAAVLAAAGASAQS